jgi:Tfp pilus assembly protein PilN
MTDRRQESSRRRTSERRSGKRNRNAVSRNVVIEVTETDLRVLVLQHGAENSQSRIDTSVSAWRKESATLDTDLGRGEFTLALQQVVQQLQLAGSRVRFVLGNKFCVTRAYLGPNDQVRSELQRLQQRSQRYLMLGTGEKVTVANLKALDARHSFAVASTANTDTLDALFSACESTGIKIDAIEPALVANARALGRLKGAPEVPCVLIHLDHETTVVGVAHQGRLLLEYRPGACRDSQALVGVVRTHLQRLERHVGRLLKQSPPTLSHVYLCGEGAQVAAAVKALSTLPGIQPQAIDPANIQGRWILNEEYHDPSLAPAFGSLLGALLPADELDAPNFMEHIAATTRESLRPVLMRSLMPIAAVLLLALGLWTFNYYQRAENQRIESQMESLAVVLARANELSLRSQAARDKLAELEKLASTLKTHPTAERLQNIAHCLPNDVWLKTLSIKDLDSAVLQGASFMEAGVFDFVRWLEQAPGMQKVVLRTTTQGSSQLGPEVDFDVELVFGDQKEQVTEVAQHE